MTLLLSLLTTTIATKVFLNKRLENNVLHEHLTTKQTFTGTKDLIRTWYLDLNQKRLRNAALGYDFVYFRM